jgi:hypothetical protein
MEVHAERVGRPTLDAEIRHLIGKDDAERELWNLRSQALEFNLPPLPRPHRESPDEE